MKKFKFYNPEVRMKVTIDNIPSNNRIFNFFFYLVMILFYLILTILNFFMLSADYFYKTVFSLDK